VNISFENLNCCDIDYFCRMNAIKQLFYIYIHGSIHVAFAVLALVLMTNHMFHNPFNAAMAGFAFSGTIFGYNFVKYESLFRSRKHIGTLIKIIAALSIGALIASGVCFFLLERITQLTAIGFFGLTILYAVPFTKKGNLRNLSGIKIYIVAFCWAGITLLLPLVEAGLPLITDVFLKFGQRFLLVIILILIFEIIDLKNDDPHLQTVPQKIGVKNTKLLNIFLLVPFYFLEFFKSMVDKNQLLVNLFLILIVGIFTLAANPERSKYYTLFWVESVPIFWLGLLLFSSHFI
jgi:hypothetical protein